MTINIDNLQQLPEAASLIAAEITRSGVAVVLFDGEMGAGKTTLIRALADALGADGSDEANSPSFAIANDYGTTPDGRHIFHFDLYRLDNEEEALDIGIEDYLYEPGNLCLIEWPDRAASLLPADAMRVAIALNPDRTRTAEISLG